MSSNPPPTPSSPEQPTFMSKVKGGFASVGRSIDASISTVMKDLGQNIRVKCPGCEDEILAPPNEFVECPKCQHQFQSPTAMTRTGQIGSQLGREAKGAVGSSSTEEPKKEGAEMGPETVAEKGAQKGA
jgi:hypothetical protein